MRRIGEAKESRYRELLRSGSLTPLPGAAEWVSRLAAAGWRQAIASSAPRANIEVMVATLDLRGSIDAWVGAEDVSRGKPDPEVFLKAARALSLPIEGCVVVEDAEAGIEAAKRAGMKCIGVGDGSIGAADLVVSSLDRLPADAFAGLLGDS